MKENFYLRFDPRVIQAIANWAQPLLSRVPMSFPIPHFLPKVFFQNDLRSVPACPATVRDLLSLQPNSRNKHKKRGKHLAYFREGICYRFAVITIIAVCSLSWIFENTT